MPILREEALTIVPPSLEELNARKSARRGQCVCQNEVEKMRRAYCLNPKNFGLMTPILPLRVSLEGGAG